MDVLKWRNIMKHRWRCSQVSNSLLYSAQPYIFINENTLYRETLELQTESCRKIYLWLVSGNSLVPFGYANFTYQLSCATISHLIPFSASSNCCDHCQMETLPWDKALTRLCHFKPVLKLIVMCDPRGDWIHSSLIISYFSFCLIASSPMGSDCPGSFWFCWK